MNRNHFILICLALAVAFSAGRFMGPKQVEIKEVEKIVYKESESKNEKKNTNFEIIETILPDGTKTTRRVRNRSTETQVDTNKELQKDTSKESKTLSRPDWSVGVYTNREDISATLDRRIFGGIMFGVSIQSTVETIQPRFGLGLRLEF